MSNLNGFYSGINNELVFIRWSDAYGYYIEDSHESLTSSSYIGEKIPSNYNFLGATWDNKEVQQHASKRKAQGCL